MSTVSVITPSFNQSQYLERCIKSVLSQGVDVEFIIVDGGSTDGSIDILRRYDQSARVIVERDNGQTDALSKGFSVARGHVLAWLNSDDMYLPDTLTKVVAAFDKGHEFVYGHTFIIDPNDRVLRKRVAIPVSFDDLYYGMYRMPQESTFFSRDLYAECGGIDTSYEYAMDYDLWLRMSRAKQPWLLDDFLSCFRFHKSQKSRNIKNYVKEMREAREKLSGTIVDSIPSRWYSMVSLGVRKTVANSKANGFFRTLEDLAGKKMGRLP